ncbi:Alpha/Beta hydrolase protein [Collybia nuda]|uniref:Alpha/Beta hydrolase protein n=1 Tax=Collybia nuda TaxID=64659 RepID=A0A9P5YFH8_9AGAR|nr:Alpha/Beta hydrolase protein [Collybia nuda]
MRRGWSSNHLVFISLFSCKMSLSSPNQFGNPSWAERATAIASLLLHMPLVLIWTLLTSPFHPVNAYKSWKRVLADKLFHFFTKHLNAAQMQWILGDTYQVYTAWMKGKGLSPVIDDLGENTRLFWIGKRRTDRVILYFHGGAFLIPMPFFFADFWEHTLTQLQHRGVDAGLAVLNYTLVPSAAFPTQLRQAVRALDYLISTGVRPENIQITGDSAGANLALQFMSHLLHPLNGIPKIRLSSPIRGAYLMSPWVSLSGEGGSLVSENDNDVVGTKCLAAWGRQVLAGIPDSQRPYIEAIKASKPWFSNLKTVVDRVLITAGDAECLRDEIVIVADRICRDHEGAQLVMHKRGVHDDPYFDFLTREAKVGEITPIIWDWLAAGFKQS